MTDLGALAAALSRAGATTEDLEGAIRELTAPLPPSCDPQAEVAADSDAGSGSDPSAPSLT